MKIGCSDVPSTYSPVASPPQANANNNHAYFIDTSSFGNLPCTITYRTDRVKVTLRDFRAARAGGWIAHAVRRTWVPVVTAQDVANLVNRHLAQGSVGQGRV